MYLREEKNNNNNQKTLTLTASEYSISVFTCLATIGLSLASFPNFPLVNHFFILMVPTVLGGADPTSQVYGYMMAHADQSASTMDSKLTLSESPETLCPGGVSRPKHMVLQVIVLTTICELLPENETAQWEAQLRIRWDSSWWHCLKPGSSNAWNLLPNAGLSIYLKSRNSLISLS